MKTSQVPRIFDMQMRRHRYIRAGRLQGSDDAARFLHEDMAEDVLDRLDFVRAQPSKAIVAGDMTGLLADALASRGVEVSAEKPETLNEEAPWEVSPSDLILSLGTMGTLNDLPGALIHTRNALADDGLFIGQIIGAGSLPTLRQIMFAADGERPAARIHPQIDNRSASALLERAGFKRQVVDTRSLKVSYRSFERMVRDLREQALTSVLTTRAPYLRKAGLARAREAFEALKDEEGLVTETFEILTLTGWR